MAKIKLNPIVEEVSGKFGNIVFRQTGDRTILTRRPDFSGLQPTDVQAAQRERFRQAVAYGKVVIADEASRKVYENAAQAKGLSVFALSVADFLNAPSIDQVDLSHYGGKTGDPITVTTHDDFEVVAVHVALTGADSAAIEEGEAIQQPAGTLNWVYTATANVPANTVSPNRRNRFRPARHQDGHPGPEDRVTHSGRQSFRKRPAGRDCALTKMG